MNMVIPTVESGESVVVKRCGNAERPEKVKKMETASKLFAFPSRFVYHARGHRPGISADIQKMGRTSLMAVPMLTHLSMVWHIQTWSLADCRPGISKEQADLLEKFGVTSLATSSGQALPWQVAQIAPTHVQACAGDWQNSGTPKAKDDPGKRGRGTKPKIRSWTERWRGGGSGGHTPLAVPGASPPRRRQRSNQVKN